jgi:uncharacterized protein YhfF
MNLEKQVKIDDIKVGDISPTKFGIELMADAIAEQVSEGIINPLTAAIKLNAMEQMIKMAKEKISDDVMTELAKHPKSKAEINGVVVTEFSSVKYDYSHLPGWGDLDKQIAELTEKRKEIEDNEKKYHRGNLPVKSASVTFKIQIPK